MVDSRDDIVGNGDTVEMSSPYALVAGINAKYARSMGYKFVWYKLLCPNHQNCNLDGTERLRAPAWGRVKAINETLSHYSTDYEVTILYLDSDSYVSDHSIPIMPFEETTAIWEDELRNRLCSGTMLWRNSQKFHEMLSSWWEFDGENRKYDQERQWEQAVLQIHLMQKYRKEIYKLPSRGWENPNHPIAFDNGYLVNPPSETVYFDTSYSLSGVDFSSASVYKNFIKHMWGGLIVKHSDVLLIEFKRLNGTLLEPTSFEPCDISERTATYWQRFCLIY